MKSAEMNVTVSSKVRICPKCGKSYSDPPALSRKDNKTQICPECGTREAMDDAGIDKKEQEKIISEIQRNPRKSI